MSVSINCFYYPMKNSRKLDSANRSIIDKKKKIAKEANKIKIGNPNATKIIEKII